MMVVNSIICSNLAHDEWIIKLCRLNGNQQLTQNVTRLLLLGILSVVQSCKSGVNLNAFLKQVTSDQNKYDRLKQFPIKYPNIFCTCTVDWLGGHLPPEELLESRISV